MTATIIQFGSKVRHQPPSAAVALPKFAGTLTDTAANSRSRAERRFAWRKSRARTDYWCNLLNFMDAVSIAQINGVKEALAHPADDASHESRLPILDSYRKALVAQLLTPAPDQAAVNWKRHELGRGLKYIPVKNELVERSIADDVAFLESHPVRKARANKAR